MCFLCEFIVQAVVAQLNAAGINCRNGHMFAYRLAEVLPGVGTGARTLLSRSSAMTTRYGQLLMRKRAIAALDLICRGKHQAVRGKLSYIPFAFVCRC